MPRARIGSSPASELDAGRSEEHGMLLNTTGFGTIDVDESRVITFPKGMVRFPRFKHFVLIEPNDEGYFWWLQSTETPDLAFVVTDPSLFVSSYRVHLKADQMQELGMAS